MSNVYDTATGRFLLIPQGSRLIGRYDSRVAYGQDGVQVVWDRIIYPDASSVDINGMVGLDSHGNAGLRDKVDRHYKRLFGFAALTSMFTAALDLSQRGTYGSGGLMYPSVSDTRKRRSRPRDEPDGSVDHAAEFECAANDKGAGGLQVHGPSESGHLVRCVV